MPNVYVFHVTSLCEASKAIVSIPLICEAGGAFRKGYFRCFLFVQVPATARVSGGEGQFIGLHAFEVGPTGVFSTAVELSLPVADVDSFSPVVSFRTACVSSLDEDGTGDGDVNSLME